MRGRGVRPAFDPRSVRRSDEEEARWATWSSGLRCGRCTGSRGSRAGRSAGGRGSRDLPALVRQADRPPCVVQPAWRRGLSQRRRVLPRARQFPPLGGRVTLRASVAKATTCTFAGTPALLGSPVTQNVGQMPGPDGVRFAAFSSSPCADRRAKRRARGRAATPPPPSTAAGRRSRNSMGPRGGLELAAPLSSAPGPWNGTSATCSPNSATALAFRSPWKSSSAGYRERAPPLRHRSADEPARCWSDSRQARVCRSLGGACPGERAAGSRRSGSRRGVVRAG